MQDSDSDKPVQVSTHTALLHAAPQNQKWEIQPLLVDYRLLRTDTLVKRKCAKRGRRFVPGGRESPSGVCERRKNASSSIAFYQANNGTDSQKTDEEYGKG